MVIKSEIEINAPLEKTFQVFTDLENLNRYVQEITNVEIVKGGKQMKTGSKWIETRKIMDDEVTNEMTVTFLDDNKIFETSFKHEGRDYRILYTFFSYGSYTHVDVVLESQHKGLLGFFLRPMDKLFKAAFLKSLEKDLSDLKKAAEAQNQE